MRAPSLLRSLVIRLAIVVVLALAGSYLVLYAEFRDGLMGLEGQSIAIQVQDLRKSVVAGQGAPHLELPPALQELYAQPDALNGYQLLSADGTVLESGGFLAPDLPLPVAKGSDEVIMQMERDARSGNSIMAAALDLDGPYLVRVVRSLDNTESLVAQLMLDALDELMAANLVRAVGRDERYDFCHALVRNVVYSSLSPSRRTRLHRRLAEAHERAGGATAGEVAEHYLRSAGLPGAEAGLPHLLEAARRAEELGAFSQAAELLHMSTRSFRYYAKKYDLLSVLKSEEAGS